MLNRRLDVGEGRERVLKSRVDLLQGRLTEVRVVSHACHTSHVTRHTSHVTRHTSHVTFQVFGSEMPMPWEEIEVHLPSHVFAA